LSLSGGCRAKAAGLVEHRQQGQADARGLGRAQQAQRQRGIVGIGPAVRVVVHIVELADRGVAGLQHLDVKPSGDGFQLPGRDAPRESVHLRAPAPEAVGLLAAEFGETGKGALECVRVQVRQAGNHRAV
jgi:hypothetical protein